MYILVVAVFILTVIELSILLKPDIFSKKAPNKPLPPTTVPTTPDQQISITLPPNFRLISSDSLDLEGRKIVYEKLGKEKDTTDSADLITGYFQGWADIAGSSDRYMIVKDIGSNFLSKYRLAFAPFQTSSTVFSTGLVVENLNQTFLDKGLEAMTGLGKIQKYAKQLDVFLKKDDVVGLIFTGPLKDIYKDDQGYKIVRKVIIRRWEPYVGQ